MPVKQEVCHTKRPTTVTSITHSNKVLLFKDVSGMLVFFYRQETQLRLFGSGGFKMTFLTGLKRLISILCASETSKRTAITTKVKNDVYTHILYIR